jgi:hypothetical protein
MYALGLKRTSCYQPTPNQTSKKKMVTTDMPVETTIAADKILKCTLYC